MSAEVSLLVSAVGFGLITASILSLAAVGFTLQFSVTNILNIAYAELMTASAFIAYLVTRAGMSVWVGLIFGGIFGALSSALLNRAIYIPFVRRGTSLFGVIIVTVAVGLIIQNGILAITGANFYSLPVSEGRTYRLGAIALTSSQLVIMAIAVCAMVAVHVLLRYTKLGKAMRATAADPALARVSGISTSRVTDISWLLSGALCGLAGVALVMNLTSFTSSTGDLFLIPVIAATMLGGIGHPYGAMLGALIIGIASEVAAAVFSPSYKELVAFVVLIVVLLARPQGIFSEVATQKEVVV